MSQNPYVLYYNPRSPFARRVRLLLRRFRLPYEEHIVDPFQESLLWKLNPLGLIPTLVTPDRRTLSDSSHLMEYFDDLTGAVWPTDRSRRIDQRQICVWTGGIMQKAVEYVREVIWSEAPSPMWVKETLDCIRDTLALLESLPESAWIIEGDFTIAGWDLCIALAYLDVRAPIIEWRKNFPTLLPLFERALQNPHFKETQPIMS